MTIQVAYLKHCNLQIYFLADILLLYLVHSVQRGLQLDEQNHAAFW